MTAYRRANTFVNAQQRLRQAVLILQWFPMHEDLAKYKSFQL